ncbi:MAG: insulinase family protein [Saprospiraceae bacterium]|nr:insulinase family protein [Saprospiraceae bacterium]
MINRKKGPISHKIDTLTIPEVEIYDWQNGTRVCEINIGSQDILKIEVIHLAGRSVEDHHLISRATASLLKDGCANKTSAVFAEKIDFHGASIKTASNMDFAYTSMYTLTKHADQIIPLLHEMYDLPTFAEDEIEKFKKLNIQKLKEELTKNEVITYRQITEEIFGKNHPYGYNSLESDYLAIDQTKIIQHFEDYYGTDNRYIIISGKINNHVRKQIFDYFGNENKKSKLHPYQSSNESPKGKKIQILSKNEHQSAIKTGFQLFNRNHPDNAAFFMLNTIFGGYFGSRLMTSIREELGYTYDIFSSVDQMLYDGCFYISTEAAPEYVPPLTKEIYHQMELLKQNKITEVELTMVKNYLMGNFMNMLDGPMNVSSFAKTMVLTDKHPSEFNIFAQELMDINAETIMNMAQKYFDEEKFIEIIVSPE